MGFVGIQNLPEGLSTDAESLRRLSRSDHIAQLAREFATANGDSRDRLAVFRGFGGKSKELLYDLFHLLVVHVRHSTPGCQGQADAMYCALCRVAAGVEEAELDRSTTDLSGRIGDERGRLTHFKMFTARETTSATVTKDAKDCNIINSFAHGVRGIVSVGLNAVAFVNDV